ncbi:MAG: manganese catalase family protein [Clostridia bacterium]|nr:manganese catalase family protein [Clostridia bacterium]
MPEPIKVKEPYPTTDGINCDAYSLRIISPAYAGSDGELNAVLQYIYHSFFFSKKGYGEIADTLKGIAIAEMRHLDLLGETVLALGAAPVYSQYPACSFNFYSTKYVAYSCSLKNMLEDDILGERRAIAAYNKMLRCLKDEQVKAVISRILSDEVLHLEKLESLLAEFKG